MKQLITILFLSILVTTCQKSTLATKNNYEGNWDFEVEYLSNQNETVRSTISNCSGTIKKSDDLKTLTINYCINDSLNVELHNTGSLFYKNKSVGEINNTACEIIINYNSKAPIQRITIVGVKAE